MSEAQGLGLGAFQGFRFKGLGFKFLLKNLRVIVLG